MTKKIIIPNVGEITRGTFDYNGFSFPANWVELATQEDAERFGFQLIEEEDVVAVPSIISDRQFFHALALNGAITQEEALEAVKTGTIPATMNVLLDTFPAEEKFAAEMLLSGATTFERNHPMTLVLAQGMNWTSAEVDELWTFASTL